MVTTIMIIQNIADKGYLITVMLLVGLHAEFEIPVQLKRTMQIPYAKNPPLVLLEALNSLCEFGI